MKHLQLHIHAVNLWDLMTVQLRGVAPNSLSRSVSLRWHTRREMRHYPAGKWPLEDDVLLRLSRGWWTMFPRCRVLILTGCIYANVKLYLVLMYSTVIWIFAGFLCLAFSSLRLLSFSESLWERRRHQTLRNVLQTNCWCGSAEIKSIFESHS